MPSECMAIGREPRSEKTEGFRACPASKEAEEIRLRRKQREFGFERRKILYEQQLVETFKNNKSS